MRPSTHRSRLRGAAVYSFAVAGLVLGHALAYAVAVPDPHHRDLVLASTGHDYLPVATQLALVLAFAAVAAALAHGVLARRDASATASGSLAVRLAVVQVCAFVGQELVERALAGAPVSGLVQEHVLVAGVVAQIVVALTGAAVLRWLVRAGSRLGDVWVRSLPVPRLVPAFALPAAADVRPSLTAARPCAARAPPSR